MKSVRFIHFTNFIQKKSETNIQNHEKTESTRTSLFEVFGETDDFADFEMLLEKCLRADSKKRPRDATQLRNESVLVDFLHQLENGARPCDLVRPPFEDEKDTKIRELKEEIAKKDRKIAELGNGRDLIEDVRQKIIEVQKQVIFFSNFEK